MQKVKFFGVKSTILFTAGFTIIYLSVLPKGRVAIYFYAFFMLLYSILFFNIFAFKGDELKVYGILPFFKKKRSITLDEVKRVEIIRSSSAKFGMTSIDFFNKNDEKIIDFKTQYFVFEIKRLVKYLKSMNIEVLYDDGVYYK